MNSSHWSCWNILEWKILWICLILIRFSVCHCFLMCIAVSLQSEQLVDLLLNTIMLSVPISGSHSHNFLSFSHGEYFYSLFQMTINTELLKNLDLTVPRLMKASSQNPSMVVYCLFLHLWIIFSVRIILSTSVICSTNVWLWSWLFTVQFITAMRL